MVADMVAAVTEVRQRSLDERAIALSRAIVAIAMRIGRVSGIERAQQGHSFAVDTAAVEQRQFAHCRLLRVGGRGWSAHRGSLRKSRRVFRTERSAGRRTSSISTPRA